MSSTVTTSENSVSQPTRIPLPGDYPRKPGRYLEHLGKRLGWRLCNAEGETLRFLEDHENEWISAAHAPYALIRTTELRAEGFAARLLELEADNLTRLAQNIALAREREEAQDRIAELEGIIAKEARRMRRANRLLNWMHGALRERRLLSRMTTSGLCFACFLLGAQWAGKIPH